MMFDFGHRKLMANPRPRNFASEPVQVEGDSQSLLAAHCPIKLDLSLRCGFGRHDFAWLEYAGAYRVEKPGRADSTRTKSSPKKALFKNTRAVFCKRFNNCPRFVEQTGDPRG